MEHAKYYNQLYLLPFLDSYTAAKSLQLCPTLCDPIDGSPSGSPVPGIPQARTLEWGAIAFSILILNICKIEKIINFIANLG